MPSQYVGISDDNGDKVLVNSDGSLTIGSVGGVVQVTGFANGYAGFQSLHDANQVTNILADQVVCSISNPPAGFYRIDVHRIAGGSGTPTLFNNGKLRIGSTDYVLMSAAVLETPYDFTFYALLTGSQSLSVRAVANGATNVTIAASITATRIS